MELSIDLLHAVELMFHKPLPELQSATNSIRLHRKQGLRSLKDEFSFLNLLSQF